jgi:hypothetical protein
MQTRIKLGKLSDLYMNNVNLPRRRYRTDLVRLIYFNVVTRSFDKQRARLSIA